MDTNRDSRISEEEFVERQLVATSNEGVSRMWEKAREELDKNSDNMLSLEEFWILDIRCPDRYVQILRYYVQKN